MNKTEKELLKAGLTLLSRWIPVPPEKMLEDYETQDSFVSFDHLHDLDYVLFSWPLLYENGDSEEAYDLNRKAVLNENVILVFDRARRIIADMAGFSAYCEDFLCREDLYDLVSLDSDWSYLAYYTLCSTMFEELPFPFSKLSDDEKKEYKRKYPDYFTGRIMMHTNAYVTGSFRKQGIFRNMLEMMSEHALSTNHENCMLYSSFALDPDIACYGPDTRDEPYIYQFEKDEPVRLANAEILKKYGFIPLRLEEEESISESDGTKLWFAVRKQLNVFLQ